LNFGQSANAWRDHQTETDVRDDVLAPVFEGDHPYVVENNFQGFIAAVNKRCNHLDEVAAKPYIIEAGHKLLEEKFPDMMPRLEWTYELFEEWNASNPPAKATAMREAIDGFMRYTDKEFGRKEIFAKVEALLKRHKGEAWAGRIVQASSDLHNALSGPILTACLKRMNATLTDIQKGDMSIYLQYSKDSTFCSERMNHGEHQFIAECDFSENDMRQCKDVQPLESLFLDRLGAPSWLLECMSAANVFTISSRTHNFKGTLKYQLPSGSTSTTFRNSVWNMTIFWAWKLKHAVKGVAFFLGDDMIVKATSAKARNSRRGRKDAARSYSHIAKDARMVAKVLVHTHLMQAEFLSKNFVPSAQYGSLMIPKLGKALGRFGVRANNNFAMSDAEYMCGKALSYAWEFRFVPEVRELALQHAVRTGLKVKDLTLDNFSYNFRREVERVGDIRTVLSGIKRISLSWYDMENFAMVRYGMPWDDIVEIAECVFLGNSDIDELAYAQLARVDYW
jgi:hypothetical protein